MSLEGPIPGIGHTAEPLQSSLGSGDMVLVAPHLGAVGVWPEQGWARQGGVPSGVMLTEPVLRSYDMVRTLGVGEGKTDGDRQGMQDKSHSCQTHPARYIAHTTTHQQHCPHHSYQSGSTHLLF